ncbi:hypothetical protein L226DRAFT_612689 [Lentinus tigrinus ALCF2SS1-7]|uniref:Uncharacterized protein n=1 Tax=Lentinus tigrinus ALCF2SS1-6 TaxID=1328759 RepID=A0A5C2SCE5_9APHY|nr:hypothetical protein L227DRAFT_652742 [Lentinus tigrinus ALCF2SS1-6]RPD75022.1 hypothetical protein L226DRAFT_612689 [Lentinus tigrinus ALCF2SS1-7]
MPTLSPAHAIFKRCGPITSSVLHSASPDPVVRLTYKYEKDAQAAVVKSHGQPADGRTLEVKVIGGVNAALSGRIGAALVGSVDVLMSDEGTGGSEEGSRRDVVVI